MAHDNTLLILGGVALAGYVLYKASPGITRSGEGVANVFGGLGDAVGGLGTGVSRVAGQLARTTEILPEVSEGVSQYITSPSIRGVGKVVQDAATITGSISGTAVKATQGTLKVVSGVAAQTVRNLSTVPARSGVSISTSSASIKIPVAGGYHKLTYTPPKLSSVTQSVKATAATIISKAKSTVSSVSKKLKR